MKWIKIIATGEHKPIIISTRSLYEITETSAGHVLKFQLDDDEVVTCTFMDRPAPEDMPFKTVLILQKGQRIRRQHDIAFVEGPGNTKPFSLANILREYIFLRRKFGPHFKQIRKFDYFEVPASINGDHITFYCRR